MPGATFLLNSPYGKDEVWDKLPRKVQQQIIDKKLKFYVIDGYKVAKDTGMGSRVNTIMQTCFFAISGVLPREEAIAKIKDSIKKTYGKKGEEIVRKNYEAVDQTLANLFEIKVPAQATSTHDMPPAVAAEAPEFVQNVTAKIMAGLGDDLPVSAMPVDGTWPTGTTKWEKRNISLSVPAWEPDLCIQCGNCSLVCPHACVRSKLYDPARLEKAPASFKSAEWKSKEQPGQRYTVQISVEDCTGCGLCVDVCPKKSKENPARRAINMADKEPILEAERANWAFFDAPAGRRPRRAGAGQHQGLPVHPAAVRVLRRLHGLRRDALRDDAVPPVRRPGADRQRHRAAPRSTAATCRPRPGRSTRTGAARRGPTRCSKTTRSSASASG